MPSDSKPTPLEILFSISRELSTTLDVHKVITRVLILSTGNIGAERASLIILNNAGQPVDAALIYDGKLASSTAEQIQDVMKYGLAGWVVRNKQAVMLSNTHEDKRWLVKPDESGEHDLPKSALCVPLMARDNVVGVLTIVHPRVGFFNEQQFRLQQAIASLAGIAVNNAQLYESVISARNRYYDLFEDNIDPILIADLNGRIIEANRQAAKVSGYSHKELVGIDVIHLHDISNDEIAKLMGDPDTQVTVKYESTLYCKGAGTLPVEVYISKITIEGHPFMQWIFRDISERKNLDRVREDLSAMIYHDLRSPLANIISSLEIMAGMLSQEQTTQLKQLFDIANRSTARMQRMISSLLDLNRLEAGQQITQTAAVDVDHLIDEAIETIMPVVRNKALVVEKLIPRTLPQIFMDEDMIRRVIINLLENAGKFSPQGSKISVGAKINSKLLTIWVEDHGPGIPVEARERIFEKFVRLRGDSMTKGLGLGLAFCKIAVQAHDGTIWVENVPEGGSRFIFTLPATMKE